MKKYKYFLLLLLSIISIGCSQKNESIQMVKPIEKRENIEVKMTSKIEKKMTTIKKDLKVKKSVSIIPYIAPLKKVEAVTLEEELPEHIKQSHIKSVPH